MPPARNPIFPENPSFRENGILFEVVGPEILVAILETANDLVY
jgi:hypothetical protein